MKQYRKTVGSPVRALIIGLFVMVFTGCTSLGDVRTQTGAEEIDEDLLTVSVSYVPKSVRFERYGKQPNPFIAEQSALTPTELLVFDAFLDNRTDTHAIALDRITLSFDGEDSMAEYPSSLRVYWQTREVSERLRGYDEQQFFRAIERDLITRGEQRGLRDTSSGLLVFRGRFPRAGVARITVPTVNLDSGSVERHTLRVQFSEPERSEGERVDTSRYE